MMIKLREFLYTEWGKVILRLVITLVLTAGIFLAIFLTSSMTLLKASDGCFVSFAVSFALGFFSLGNKFCLFTSFQYGFSYIFGSLGRYYRFRNGGTYGDFVEAKKEKQKDTGFLFATYFVVSVCWLVAAFVLLGVFNQIPTE